MSQTSGRIQTPLQPYEEAIANGAIEAGIRVLTDALNAQGLTPIASCQGHASPRRWYQQARLERTPFVLFRATVDVAHVFTAILTNGHGQKNELYYVWRLVGYFNPPEFEELVWMLEPHDIRIHDQWDRRQVDADIAALARMVTAFPTP